MTDRGVRACLGERRSAQHASGPARRVVDDVRTLRSGALVRGSYELSKRIGGHDLVFGRMLKSAAVPSLQVPLLGMVGPVPQAAATRTLDAARQILDGHVRVFGRDIVLATEPDWHAALDCPTSWPLEPWWRIDIRSDQRIADVKWAWELSRHRHLVTLARSLSLQSDGERTVAALTRQLDSWISQNPPEQGVHWYSNLEISLRALAWLQVHALAADFLPEEVIERMTAVLYHSGRHLVADLPYTLSSMRNNHLLGDALGLIALGKAFASSGAARHWVAIGDRLFDAQLRRHMRSDGSMIEDSVSYHRFVLEMLIVRVLLGDAPAEVVDGLLRGAQFLARLGVAEGAVPQYGDWDEGRVLVATADPSDMSGTLRLALALSGSGAPREWREAHDEVCWHSREGTAAAAEPAERCGAAVGGGLARAVKEGFTVWLKAGGGTSHAHADLCSLVVAIKGQALVGDPGTGTYNGPLAERNYFRSSLAHNVIRVGLMDQFEPHRAFRWRHAGTGCVGPALHHSGVVIMWGAHDAYRRLIFPRIVARVVVVGSDGVTVADWVSGPPGESFAVSIPLPAGVELKGSELTLCDGTRLELALGAAARSTSGQRQPYDGWWSATYGEAEPATRLEMQGVIDGPVWWAVSEPGAPTPRVDGDHLHIGKLRMTVEWHDQDMRLVLSDGETEQIAFLSLS